MLTLLLYHRINTCTVELRFVLISEHSCAVSSFSFVLMTINGQAGPGRRIALLFLWILSVGHDFRSVSLDPVVFKSSVRLLVPFGRRRENVAESSLVSRDESCVTVTFAPMFSPSRQAGHKTSLRHLTLGHDHTGVTALS